MRELIDGERMRNQALEAREMVESLAICQHYTPSMLADLLAVDVRTIRAWLRRGLLIPVNEVHRLPYFDYQGVVRARQLAKWRAEGISAKAIEEGLSRHAARIPGVAVASQDLSVVLQGRRLLARDPHGLIDPSGQRCFDFEGMDPPLILDSNSASEHPFHEGDTSNPAPRPEDLLNAATFCEESGDIAGAVDLYRVFLFQVGPHAEANFALAELLYRMGELTAARERYACALEMDENYLEARANLGCVFAELGQFELAVAAFRGTLERHAEYPDVHYHLAQLLDQLQDSKTASHHWQRFLELAPDSPWADAARARLGQPV